MTSSVEFALFNGATYTFSTVFSLNYIPHEWISLSMSFFSIYITFLVATQSVGRKDNEQTESSLHMLLCAIRSPPTYGDPINMEGHIFHVSLSYST